MIGHARMVNCNIFLKNIILPLDEFHNMTASLCFMKWCDVPLHIAREENSTVYVSFQYFLLDK
jgi:hypothetical protein